MKKILSIFTAFIMLFGTVAFAVDYGSEWTGYTPTAASSFSDVPSNHWARDNIDRVVAKGWFDGYPDGTFHPENSIKRSEAMTVFVKFLGLQLKNVQTSSYHDVPVSEWYSPYIETGKKLFPQITTYNGQHPFQPEMPITREDTIYALVTALKYTDDTVNADQSVLNMFKDKDSISAFIRPYVAVAVNKRLVDGYDDGTIGAQDPLTRAEFATLLYRASFVGFGTSVLNLEEDNSTIQDVILTPSGTYQMHVGETTVISALAKMSDGVMEDYSANLQPTSDSSAVTVNGTVITANSAGTATIRFLNDTALADKTITVIVSAPTAAPEFGQLDYPSSVSASTATISGTVSDPSGAAMTLDIDGENIAISSNRFSTQVNLDEGTNTFILTLRNSYGTSTVKTVKIRRESETPTIAPTAVPTAEPSHDSAYVVAYRWSVDALDLTEGETATIKLFEVYSDGSEEDCTREFFLSSTDDSVASVNSNGKITANSAGTALISFSNALPASLSMPRPLKVTVKAAARTEATLTGLEWSVDSVSIRVGATKKIKLYGIYSDGSKVDMTEECGVYVIDEDIASFNGGTVKGLSEGETELWFSSAPSVNISMPGLLEIEITE